MNFAGPIDTKLLNDSPVSLDGEGFSFSAKPGFVQHHSSDAHVVVPDSHLLFSGDYTRIGSDLIISNAEQKFVVGNYFKGETRPTLTSSDGATLSGQIVDALTGHVHYAQAAAPVVAQVIGHVLKMSGSASAIRNGVSVELHIGDAVQKGDVVQTGSDSSIGMTFVDGSAFGMTSNARMVLNEMIYDPNGSSNSSLISLVQGTITFVAGQTAKNGNMRVETPVATMGIRGTAVLVEIAANDGPTKFSVLAEPDGHTGSFNLYDKTTGQLIGTVSQAGQVTFVSVGGIGQPPTAVEQLKTLADQEAAKSIINQVFQLYFPNFNPDNSNPKSQKFGSSSTNNLADIVFTTTTFNQQTILTQIELRFAVVDPLTGAVTYQNRIFYNTKAVFSADSVTAEQSFVSSNKSFKISDVVHIDDPDINNAPFYDKATPFVAGSAVIKSAVSTNPNLSASFLSQFLHIDQQTGVVSFDRLAFNFLGQGESVTFMLQVTAQSGPDTAQVIIPIIITGDNDVPNGAPTIVFPVSDIEGAVKEDTHVTPGNAIASNGTITFRDVDLTDTHTVSHEFTSSSSTLPGFATGTHLGTFTIDLDPENTTDTVNLGTVQWHFSLPDNDSTLQSLAEGQTITQIYTITIKDIHGAFVTQTVTITITGTNDAPVLSADASIHQADEVPDTTGAPNSVVDVATGTLTFLDVDLSDTHQAHAALHPGATSVVWSGGDYNDIPQATRDALNDAVTASVSENNTDANNQGSVGWEFKLPDHLFDFLAEGQTLTLIYDVTVTDNNGLSSTKQVTVQIGAANDQPVISVIDNDAAVKEDVGAVGNILKDTGSVTFTDADLTDTHTAHVTYNNDAMGSAGVSPALAAALATALTVPTSALAAGDHDFNWDFALDTSLIQYLAEGETITATYTITVEDNSNGTNDTSSGKTVTVTITGTNDAPVIAVTNPAANTESNTGTPDLAVVTVADHVSVSDVDTSDVRTPYAGALAFDATDSSGPVPAGGTLADLFSLDTFTGKISYDKAAFDYLADGEHVTAVFTFNVSSGPDTVQKSITVTINGVNDAPAIAVTDPVAVNEGDAGTPVVETVVVADHVSISDVDASDAHVPYVANTLAFDSSTGPAPSSGILANLFALNETDGTISYDRAAFDYLRAGEHLAATFTFDASSGPDTVQKSITVTIDGVNDAPTVSAALVDTASEGAAAFTRNLLLGASDADKGEAATLHLANITYKVDGGIASSTIPVGLSLGPDGHTLTIDPSSSAFDHLAVGQHTTIEVSYDIMDAQGATVPQTETITINGTNDAPVISLDHMQLSPHLFGVTTVSGLSVSDVDDGGSGLFTVTTFADHGTVTPTGGTNTLSAINSAFQTGLAYRPTDTAPIGHGEITVTDNQGASDTVNFVFRQSGSSPLNLTGNANQTDVLIGGTGVDNFVFAAHSGHDTVFNFVQGTDKIDFQALTSIDTSALTALLATADHTGGNTLLHLNGNTDTLLVKGVASLNASDFILHA